MAFLLPLCLNNIVMAKIDINSDKFSDREKEILIKAMEDLSTGGEIREPEPVKDALNWIGYKIRDLFR